MDYGRTIKIFAERDLYLELRKREQEIKAEVEGRPDNYVLNVNETEYVNYLVSRFSIEPIAFQFDQVTVEDYERMFRLEGEMAMLHFSERGEVKRDVYRFHLPFTGDDWLLKCAPSQGTGWTQEFQVRDHSVSFDVVVFWGTPDEVARQVQSEKNQILAQLKVQAEYLATEVMGFVRSLHTTATDIFQRRKQHLLRKYNTLSALGVPIRSNDQVAGTFSIPAPQQRAKINITPPVVNDKGFKPDPTLDDETYTKIVRAIHDIGKQLERMPSTYQNKGEEDLRDIILVFLEPQFVGSATGETFNKAGKTDILLRHDGNNAFIAECKFWKGEKQFQDAISQLLSYLTWRDSKAALILFVQNKDLSNVIASVEAKAPSHSNYLGFVSKREETWLDYRFHIDGDRNREVKLAVLLFHVPK